MLLPLLCLLSPLTASAGTVSLKTDVALSVERGGVTIGRAPGPGVLPLGDFPPGEAQIRLHRQDLSPLDATFSVPSSGGLMLNLDGDTLTTDTVPVRTSDAPPPVIIFRPLGTQQFSVILNGKTRTLITEETVIDHWGPGIHKLEVRSADNLTVWARGELTLDAGQSVVINLDAGRALDVQGTAGAWKPLGRTP
jgi:hypothetical protein